MNESATDDPATVTVSGIAVDGPAPGQPPKEVEIQQQEASRQYRSKVNGLGMWSAWERNFSNKLKACLDLVDNAVDAALWDSDDEEDEEEENEGDHLTVQQRWKKQSGSIHISTEKHRLALGEYHSDESLKGDDGSDGISIGKDGADTIPKPFIVHDILGSLGGRMKASKGDQADAVEGSNDFRLIDDENTLCLHNDCVNPVKELRKVLDVYNSDKTESAIGENGVGVKQAAAAMSDLSIVITTRIDEEPLLMDYGNSDNGENSARRIRKCLVSIGVLAKKMQSPDACVIPSWTLPIEFNIDENDRKKIIEGKKMKTENVSPSKNGKDDEDIMDVGDESLVGDTCKPVLMRALLKITSDNRLLMKTMKEFGGAATKNRRKYGIQRLTKHIELMVSSPFSNKSKGKPKPPHPHQYLMILHKFGKHQTSSKNGVNNDVAIAKARNELDDLLRDLADEMPRTYLHIPPAPYFKIRVNQELLKFQYWERHLVELHRIPLIVDRKNDFRTAEDWLIPENEDDTYEINVSIGFDPTRANPHGSQHSADNMSSNFIGGQACSLMIFSRISGRLFLKHDDARGVLRLSNSGTSYCQGLTIIVDDFEGHLPLTPTKESLAFGMEDYGKIHERNLYAWLGALANVYWTHFHNLYKTKRALGNAVKGKMDRVKQLDHSEAIDLPTLRFGSFSTVEKLSFSRERVRDSIRPYKSEFTKWSTGPSTLIKLGGANPKPKKPPKSSTTGSGKRKATDLSVYDGYDSDGNDLMEGAPPSSAFENNISNANDELPDEKEEKTGPVRQRRDGRPVRATKEPQRFEEVPEPPKSRKKRFKVHDGTVVNFDAHLKKQLKSTQAELSETQLELNASKATCDDLQMQLEEVEQSAAEERNKISQLENELHESRAKHEAEMQRVRDNFNQQLEALKARLKESEEKK
eukprot:CAMPEP_0197179678 /NCGR_PEP_ID=MMETSP1423-20130617/4543_1 /TAXON_ID=476441 /ORGANISM="Pseudo-nitzschia heimii, Strain UNC1101" /LENGTH=922 /DNA_ID=CAMNT_0042629619 /DNA_START=90 /DNA_END=2858 /DNA_ORIENTATION=+